MTVIKRFDDEMNKYTLTMIDKKERGEVFTPLILVETILNTLPANVWKDPSLKWLEPSGGFGVFVVCVYQRLMKGLKNKFPDDNERRRWIFKEMIHYNELNEKNVEVYKRIIGLKDDEMNVYHCDYLKLNIEKFDVIIGNPPYGVKGIKWNDYSTTYCPIRSNNIVCLFLQKIIHDLKDGGHCAVIIPNGQELSSRSRGMVGTRKLILDCCKLKNVISIGTKAFKEVSIRSAILTFNKKSGTDRDTIDIYDENGLLYRRTVKEVKDNEYRLNYHSYIKIKVNTTFLEQFDNVKNVKNVKLGDVVDFKTRSKRPASYGLKEGKYPFFKSSNIVNSWVDEPDFKEECLVVGDGGEANINHSFEFSCSDHCHIMSNKKGEEVILKYVYYYIKNNLNLLGELFSGVGIQNISKTNLSNFEIPLPSLERQKQLVEQFDNVKNVKNVKIVKLGDVCDFKRGEQLSKKNCIEGEYPVIGGGRTPTTYHNEYNRDENTILCSSSGVGGYISRYNSKVWISDCFSIHSKDKNVLDEGYLYYYLKNNQDEIYKLRTGMRQFHVNLYDMKNVEIPLPSLERQKQLVEQNVKNIKLGDVVDFKRGKQLSKKNCIEGEYPVIGGGRTPVTYHNDYNRDENTILCSRTGMGGYISRYNSKVWVTDACYSIHSKDVGVLDEGYLYYYLKNNQDEIYKLRTGIRQFYVNPSDMKNIEIPLPSLERQKELIL